MPFANGEWVPANSLVWDKDCCLNGFFDLDLGAPFGSCLPPFRFPRINTITTTAIMTTSPRLRSQNRLARKSRIVRAICAAGIAAFCSAHAADVTSTWNSATSGLWNVNANWNNAPALGGFPNNGNGGVATYDAVISAAGPAYTVTLNMAITVANLQISSANATLNHTSGSAISTTVVPTEASNARGCCLIPISRRPEQLSW